MGWLKSIGSLIVNGNGAGEKLLDASISGIDKAFYTDEEKAEKRAEAYARWQDLQLVLAEKGTGTAVNRRIVSWFVLIAFMLSFLVTLGFSLAGYIEQARTAMEVAENFKVGWAFSAVIVFYFGPHVVGAYGGRK